MQHISRQKESTISTVERPSASEGLRDRLKIIVDQFGSNSAFARHIGVAETTIRRWINGSVEPKHHSLVGVAAAANVSIEWLMSGKGEMRPQETIRLREAAEVEYKTTARSRQVQSDNMEPTLCFGDDIGIEAVSIAPSQVQSGVYVVRIGGSEGIWRLQGTPDKKLWLLNDNPKYHQSNTAVDLSEAKDLEIVARVTWVRHEL
jgi:phage repressor protein C with HTH and peptisase S24 domain